MFGGDLLLDGTYKHTYWKLNLKDAVALRYFVAMWCESSLVHVNVLFEIINKKTGTMVLNLPIGKAWMPI